MSLTTMWETIRAIDLAARALTPALLVQTAEERRFLAALMEMTTGEAFSKQRGRPVIVWSSTVGAQQLGLDAQGDLTRTRLDQGTQPPNIITFVQGLPERNEGATPSASNGSAIYVILDVHHYLFNVPGSPGFQQRPILLRALRDAITALRRQRKTVLLVTPTHGELPVDLQHELDTIEVPLPSRDELASLFDTNLQEVQTRYAGVEVDTSASFRTQMVRAMQGLTENDAAAAMRKGLTRTRAFNERMLDEVQAHKNAVVNDSGLLRVIDTPVNPDEVGGMDNLRAYLGQRSAAWTDEARAYGVERPRGVLLVGPPGAGKSMVAKMVASMWGMPLIRFDVGQLMNHLLGSSEARLREAFKIIEANAPAVLWMDELEKMFGSGSGELDGGTRASMFGTLLTWMNDVQAEIYIAATANDVSKLRGELLRAGRFDARFFVDLPNLHERQDILEIHLRSKRRNPDDFNLAAVARATDTYTGAELRQVVIDAITNAFADGARPLTDADLLRAARGVTPIAATMREQIEGLRRWATARAQFASTPVLEFAERNGAGTVELEG